MSEKKTKAEVLEQLIGARNLRALRERGVHPVVTLEPNELSESEELEAVEAVIAECQQDQAKAQRLATIGTMGAGIVHEARNVLTSVTGFAQMARRPKSEKRRLEFLETIEDETKRAVEMLANILSFSRNRPKTARPFAINEPLSRARRATLHQLQLHRVGLEVTLHDANPTVIGSQGEVEQILVNLILNAQQASKTSSVVTVVAKDIGGGFAEISVSDQGGGIDSENLETVFDPFFTTKSSGTGLGLAVSRRIAEEHGGTLTCESTLGEGTTFRLTLPVAVTDGEQAQ